MSCFNGIKGGCSSCPAEKAAKEEVEQEQQRELPRQLDELCRHLERFNLAGYLELLNRPRRYLVLNFLGGLSRGFGVTLGFTLLGALVLWALQRLVMLNLPLIGDFIADLVRIVLTYL